MNGLNYKMNEPKFYLVGGSLRDEFLGLKSKDLDYVVVCESFDDMRQAVLNRGGEIFVEKPEYLTIRANVPGLGATDFVCARRDGTYSDGRRPDSVEVGSLIDDLSRRDFTVGAMARDVDTNELIDPFNGVDDCKNKILRCVGDPYDRFTEDFLRILRAARFNITKDLSLDDSIVSCLCDLSLISGLRIISKERIYDELTKMFRHDTLETLKFFEDFSDLRDIVFGPEEFDLWLRPTLEKR